MATVEIRRAPSRAPSTPKPRLGVVDVSFEIFANAKCDCPSCGWNGRLRDFGRHVWERAGMKIVDCECVDCGTAWKRIEV